MTSLSRPQFVASARTVSVSVAGLALLAGCALPFWTPPPAVQVHRIAYLAASPPAATADQMSAFRQALRDLGYVEGQNLVIEQRYTDGIEQAAEPAAELVRLQPEVILVPSSTVARAALAATTTIPIVSAGMGASDLVASRLAASHARPGGTVTGLNTPSSLVGKQLQLLQEAVPTLSRVAVLFDTASSTVGTEREPLEAAFRTRGLQLQFVGVGGPADLEPGVEAATREHVDGLFIAAGPVISSHQTRIAELALQSRLPSMWQQSEAVGRGGLMAYGANRADGYRRAAYFVDRILKGSSPADLPVEEPMLFDFVVNMNTAQALAITFPPEIMLQVTEIIQ